MYSTRIKIKTLLVVSLLSFVAVALAKPLDPEPKKSQAEVRASLITKHNVKEFLANNRKQKQLSEVKLPAPFVITTSLNIDSNEGRRGKSYPDGQGNTIVEGVRLPDDTSDKTTYRNGRFINNVFVPETAVVPAEAVVTSDDKKAPRVAKMMNDDQTEGRSFNPGFDEYYLGGGNPAAHDSLAVESRTFEQIVAAPRLGFADSSEPRDYNYKGGKTQNGRPIYYVAEEPDSLHADRSPYNFEPADNQDSFTGAVADFTHSGVSPANQGDFVIKEHTYTMCPGCPTFSIPVPIPKASLVEQQQEQEGEEETVGNVDYQSAKDKNFLQKIGDRIVSTMKGIQDKTLGLLDPILSKGGNFLGLSDDTNTITEKKGDAGGSKTSYLPIMVAGAAAVALGGLAMFGGGPSVNTINARSLEGNAKVDLEETTAILDSIDDATTKYEKQE